MTFSIVARNAEGDTWGVAVASKVLAVGRAVPGAEAGVGAVATQAFCNLNFRPRSLAMMRENLPTGRGRDGFDSRRSRRLAATVRDRGPARCFH